MQGGFHGRMADAARTATTGRFSPPGPEVGVPMSASGSLADRRTSSSALVTVRGVTTGCGYRIRAFTTFRRVQDGLF